MDVAANFDPAFLDSVLPPDFTYGDLSATAWGRDVGRSVFLFGDETATGRELVGRQFEPKPGLAVHFRAVTDGSLFGAMRAATWTHEEEPAELYTVRPKALVEPEWEDKLAAIGDPALRDHLRMMCLTEHGARSQGAYYFGTGECPAELGSLAEQPGHTFVTGWRFGEGQGSSAIFRIAP